MKEIRKVWTLIDKEVEVKYRIKINDDYCDGHFAPSPPLFPCDDFNTKVEAEEWKKQNKEKYALRGEIQIIEIITEC